MLHVTLRRDKYLLFKNHEMDSILTASGNIGGNIENNHRIIIKNVGLKNLPYSPTHGIWRSSLVSKRNLQITPIPLSNNVSVMPVAGYILRSLNEHLHV
jgi:hypothetical protein